MVYNLKLIKTFESFNKEALDNLILFDKSYLEQSRQKKLLKSVNQTYAKIVNLIKKYDFNNFNIDIKPYMVEISPDANFVSLLNDLNQFLKDKVDLNIKLILTIDVKDINQINFMNSLPREMRGMSIGYRVYKLMLEEFRFLTTNRHASLEAYNVWYNLLQDESLYAFTSNQISGVISKDIDNNLLRNILEKIKAKNLKIEFDSELEQKIIELYGSLDKYN